MTVTEESQDYIKGPRTPWWLQTSSCSPIICQGSAATAHLDSQHACQGMLGVVVQVISSCQDRAVQVHPE
ncbi:hypothetical protein XELAEV_18000723mg [Xenopus laevis]|nr:hypothetical protein XELAEV_18000723mg [Xenopus laevis]